MKKSIKKLLCVALCAVTAVTSVFVYNNNKDVQASSSSWNFKSNNFKNLGTISSTKTVDGLGLIATSSKKMSVKAENATVSGTKYTYALALGGTGSTSYRAVKVPVSGASTLKVVLASSGSSTRNLVVADSNGKKLTTLSATKSAALQSYSYKGSAGSLYLYSTGSGIDIFKIQVDTASGSSSSSSNSGSSSSNSGSSNSGSSSNSSTTVTKYANISDGWYYIKNINSQKYLQVAGNSGKDGANVEQGTGTGVAGR